MSMRGMLLLAFGLCVMEVVYAASGGLVNSTSSASPDLKQPTADDLVKGKLARADDVIILIPDKQPASKRYSNLQQTLELTFRKSASSVKNVTYETNYQGPAQGATQYPAADHLPEQHQEQANNGAEQRHSDYNAPQSDSSSGHYYPEPSSSGYGPAIKEDDVQYKAEKDTQESNHVKYKYEKFYEHQELEMSHDATQKFKAVEFKKPHDSYESRDADSKPPAAGSYPGDQHNAHKPEESPYQAEPDHKANSYKPEEGMHIHAEEPYTHKPDSEQVDHDGRRQEDGPHTHDREEPHEHEREEPHEHEREEPHEHEREEPHEHAEEPQEHDKEEPHEHEKQEPHEHEKEVPHEHEKEEPREEHEKQEPYEHEKEAPHEHEKEEPHEHEKEAPHEHETEDIHEQEKEQSYPWQVYQKGQQEQPAPFKPWSSGQQETPEQHEAQHNPSFDRHDMHEGPHDNSQQEPHQTEADGSKHMQQEEPHEHAAYSKPEPGYHKDEQEHQPEPNHNKDEQEHQPEQYYHKDEQEHQPEPNHNKDDQEHQPEQYYHKEEQEHGPEQDFNREHDHEHKPEPDYHKEEQERKPEPDHPTPYKHESDDGPTHDHDKDEASHESHDTLDQTGYGDSHDLQDPLNEPPKNPHLQDSEIQEQYVYHHIPPPNRLATEAPQHPPEYVQPPTGYGSGDSAPSTGPSEDAHDEKEGVEHDRQQPNRPDEEQDHASYGSSSDHHGSEREPEPSYELKRTSMPEPVLKRTSVSEPVLKRTSVTEPVLKRTSVQNPNPPASTAVHTHNTTMVAKVLRLARVSQDRKASLHVI